MALWQAGAGAPPINTECSRLAARVSLSRLLFRMATRQLPRQVREGAEQHLG